MEPEVLFGTKDPSVLAEKADRFVRAMESLPGGTLAPDPESGAQLFKAVGWNNPAVRALSMFEDQSLNKAMDPGLLAQVQTQLADLQKDLTPTSPLSTGFVAYDLDPVIGILRFMETPIRNRVPRTKGQGKSYQFKMITGATGLGGPGNIPPFHPGITDSTQTRFDNPGSANGLYFNRPPKISYAGVEYNVPYVQTGLSDELSWSTQLQAIGFTDLRAMSRTTLMLAHMALEERLMLLGRGTQTGYNGALAAPGTPTGAARSKAGSEVGLSGVTTNVWAIVTADAGDFGQSVLSAQSVAIAATNSSQVVDITIPDVVGATGYRVYVGTGASAPATSAMFYAGRTGSNVFTLTGALPTATTAASTVAADTSAYAQGYDGIVPICLGPNAGFVNRINSTLSTSSAGAEYQTVFAGLWDAVKARPNRFMVSGADYKQLNETIKNSPSASSYRLTIGQGDVHGVTTGALIAAIINETAGGDVIPEVHAYLPQGVSPVLTDQLPMPSEGVTDIWEARNLQDVMAIEWPVVQFSYDASTYQYGTFFCRAPGYQGAVAGIKKA
jgi:hypothetical protein